MSGAEPIIIGAALGAGMGAGSSAIMGGDPLKGALLGGVTGGFTGGLGGIGSTAAAGANTAAQAGVGGAQSTIGASLVEGGASGILGDIMEQAALGQISVSPNAYMTGLQQFASNPYRTMGGMGELVGGIGMGGGNMQKLMMAQSMMGGMGGGQNRQEMVAPPSLKPAQQPQVNAPVAGLLDERMRMPQRRRMSLV
jgi:hypothetical protein